MARSMVRPYIPALRGLGGGLVVAPAEKASLLGNQFDSKQCREQFVTPLFSFPQSMCTSSVLLHLLFDLDMYGVVNPLGVFLLFLQKIADIIVPKLSIIFCRLIRLGSFPECCRFAKLTAIPKIAPSPDRRNYRPISITLILYRCMRSQSLTNSPIFARNIFFCLLLSFRIGKVLAALMHCLPYLITFRSP